MLISSQLKTSMKPVALLNMICLHLSPLSAVLCSPAICPENSSSLANLNLQLFLFNSWQLTGSVWVFPLCPCPRESLHIVTWGNCRPQLVCFTLLRDHCPVRLVSQCVKVYLPANYQCSTLINSRKSSMDFQFNDPCTLYPPKEYDFIYNKQYSQNSDLSIMRYLGTWT